MNTILKYIVFCFLFCSLSITSSSLVELSAQNKKTAKPPKRIEWSLVKMDSLWNSSGELASTKIIAKYKPKVDSLDIIVGTTAKELLRYPPESPLSNLAVDIIRFRANDYLASKGLGKADIALTNFGGIRTVFKQGGISVSDIFSVFPFDNRIVILEIKGKYIKKMLDDFAAIERMEPLSGIELIIENKKVSKLLVGGKIVDDEKIYKLATIDFILGGGDKIFILKKAQNVIETGILIRDAVIEYFIKETKANRLIDANVDNRVIIK